MRKFLLCLCVMWSAGAIAQTTNWYVDNEIYQTTTCESGANVTPPSAPAKHGYTFVGWYDADVTVGSWSRIGTPTPDNPIYPTFYQDGDLILRAIGSGADMIADTYNQTTGQITRRVGVKVLDGTEGLLTHVVGNNNIVYQTRSRFPTDVALMPGEYVGICSHFIVIARSASISTVLLNGQMGWNTSGLLTMENESCNTVEAFNQYLSSQYAAGTPVTIYYPLATPIVETYTPSTP